MRVQSRGEEIANGVSHGLGLVAAIAAIPVLVVAAARGGGAAEVTGAAVFGASMVLLYLASTLYHGAPPGRAKEMLRRFDHAAIFLLIAGSYTPFTLGVLGGAWGWSLFGVVWGLAVIGLAVKLAGAVHAPALSAALYVGMGWIALVAIEPLRRALPAEGLALLVAGGVAYTAGVAFFLAPRLRYAHLVWHLFVLAGTTCHFFAVLRYAV
jgi:hemolysin III